MIGSRKNLFTHSLTLFILLLWISPVSAQQFTAVVDATGSDGCYVMTPDLCHMASAVWANDKLDLSEVFELEFKMNFGVNNGTGFNDGGDGMVFVIHNDSRGTAAIGCSGGVMAYADKNSCNLAITPSVGFEFDTHPNSILDPVLPVGHDHIMCVQDGNLTYVGQGDNGVGRYQDVGELEDGANHTIKVTWDPYNKIMELYLDGVLKRTENTDLVLQLGDTEAFWGWTGSTWGETNLQSVKVVNSPFPIELTEFKAEPSGDAVAIDWSTASETNNDKFILERSEDGVDFEKVEEIKGAGTSPTPKSYHVRDDFPFIGVTYYRLVQTDFNGLSSNSEVIAVEISPDELNVDMAVFPNPATDNITVSLRNMNTAVDLEVLNASGQILYRKIDIHAQGDWHLDTGNWPSGMYFSRISSIDGTYNNQEKFVIK